MTRFGVDGGNSGLREKYDTFKKRLHNAHNYRKQVEGAEQVKGLTVFSVSRAGLVSQVVS